MFLQNVLEFATAVSRAKTMYDLANARNYNDIFRTLANAGLSELALYSAKQNIRNQYRYYW